jgi:ADP-glucose pyrophosphorylase
MLCVLFQDYYKHKAIEHILILSGDQLYRMDYMELVQVGDPLKQKEWWIGLRCV